MGVSAVIFDFGGVILTSPFEAFARYERDNGLPAGFVRRLNATDPDTNAWARLERGEVDAAGFAELFEAEGRAAGHEIDARALLALLAGEVRPAMVDALRRCHDRLKTALLTNNFVIPGAAGDALPELPMAGLADLFDVVIESSKVGLRKPDTAIYELACLELGVAPSEAVFLDDLGVNLKPARAMGMTTIKVDEPDRAIAELERVVGFPLR
ncbi:MAG TPA: HAD-IA family hydrolase [Acidimicrobiales bacterium]|nr:HAD-IA family hydrolase [Acidimicrobiales bacterium]